MPEELTPGEEELLPLPKRKIIPHRPPGEEVAEETIAKEKLFFPSEIDKTQERITQMQTILKSLLEFGLARGVDLRSRIPGIDKIHFLDEANFGKAKEHYRPHQQSDSFIVYSTGDIFIEENPSEEETLHSVGHELIHGAAHLSMVLKRRFLRKPKIEMSRHGFANLRNQVFLYFTEAIIEMANLDMIINFWPKHEELRVRDLNIQKVSYPEQIIIIDSILRRVAHSQNMKYRQYLESLERSLFLGDMSFLRPIAKYLGPQGFKTLSRLEHEPEKVEEYARALGLEDALTKLQFEGDETPSIFDGIDDLPSQSGNE